MTRKLVEQFIGAAQDGHVADDGLFHFKVKVTEADRPNGNGRVYSRHILEREFRNANASIRERPGLSNHPDDGDGKPNDIAIRWDKFELDEAGIGWGHGAVLPTDSGRNLRVVMENGVAIGFSKRGDGSTEVRKDGDTFLEYVRDDYSFITVDAVNRPSVGTARFRLGESMDNLKEYGQLIEAKTKAEGALETANKLVEAKDNEIVRLTEAKDAEIKRLNEALAERTTELDQLKAASETAVVDVKLFELTESHRFGATVRTQIVEQRSEGLLTVTLENVEKLVDRYTKLAESFASGEGRAAPRGNPNDNGADALTEAEEEARRLRESQDNDDIMALFQQSKG